MSESSIGAVMASMLREHARDVVDLMDARVLPVRPRWLRPDEAAAYINIDKTSLGNFRSQGIGPKYRKVGSRVVYAIDDLIEFVERNPLLGSGSLEAGA